MVDSNHQSQRFGGLLLGVLRVLGTSKNLEVMSYWETPGFFPEVKIMWEASPNPKGEGSRNLPRVGDMLGPEEGWEKKNPASTRIHILWIFDVDRCLLRAVAQASCTLVRAFFFTSISL